MIWSPWNPHPIQPHMGLRNDVLVPPFEERNRAAFDVRSLPPCYALGGSVLERVLGDVGVRSLDASSIIGVDELRQKYGANVFDPMLEQWLSQEYAWNRNGVTWSPTAADRFPCLYLERGPRVDELNQPLPLWMFAAGVRHDEADYQAPNVAVNEWQWSLWHHSQIPWDGEFDPSRHDVSGYPMYSTDELPETDNANVRQSPNMLDEITLSGRTVTGQGSRTLRALWP